jgi:hypothetical protein
MPLCSGVRAIETRALSDVQAELMLQCMRMATTYALKAFFAQSR